MKSQRRFELLLHDAFPARSTPGRGELLATVDAGGQLILWQSGLWEQIWTSNVTGDVSAQREAGL